MKKVFLPLAFSAFSLSLPAKAMIWPNDFDGFYVGVEGGGSFTTARENTFETNSFFYTSEEIADRTFHADTLASQGWMNHDSLKGAINAGFGYSYQLLYLGLEIFSSVSNYKMSTSQFGAFVNVPATFTNSLGPVNTHVKLRTFEYGIDVRPGFLVTPRTLLYGRVGAAFNRLSINTDSILAEGFVPPLFTGEIFPLGLDSSSSKNITGLRLGVGLADQIMPPLSIQLDYIWTDYGSINLNNSANALGISVDRGPFIITVASNPKVDVTNNTILLGLSYNFQNQQETTPSNYWSVINGDMLRGFYIGASGGGSFTNAKGDIVALGGFDQPPVLQPVPFTSSDDIAEKSLAGSLYAGYGFLFNYFYIAPEAFIKFSQFRETTLGSFDFFNAAGGVLVSRDGTAVNSTAKLNPVEYGIDFRPGLILGCNTLIYGRVGTGINKLTINLNTTFITQAFPAPGFVSEIITAGVNSSTSKTVATLRLGGGIEQRVNQYFSIRGDYIYTDYGNIETSNGISFPFTSVNLGPITMFAIGNTHRKITSNTVLLGLSFYPKI